MPAWDDLSAEARQDSARRMELYAGMVEHMDANIGTLTGYLKTAGLYDDTLIIFLSDSCHCLYIYLSDLTLLSILFPVQFPVCLCSCLYIYLSI